MQLVMAPPSCKLTAMAVLVYVLALIHFSAGASLDIIGFTDSHRCVGFSTACSNVSLRTCCRMLPGVHSVRFYGLGPWEWGNVYNINFCGDPALFSRKGPVQLCVVYAGDIQSATVVRKLPTPPPSEDDRGLIESDDERGCNSTVLPNAVVYYTSDEAWVLISDSDKVESVLKYAESLPEDQHLTWMKNAGAELHPSMGKTDIYDAGVGTE